MRVFVIGTVISRIFPSTVIVGGTYRKNTPKILTQ